MAKKSSNHHPALSLMPDEYKQMFAATIAEQIAQAMAEKESAGLEPFFRTKEFSDALKRNQTVAQQNGWHWYYEAHGCIHCHENSTPHAALGFCRKCFTLITKRRQALIRLHEPEPGREETFRDTANFARKALLPSIEKLARKRRSE